MPFDRLRVLMMQVSGFGCQESGWEMEDAFFICVYLRNLWFYDIFGFFFCWMGGFLRIWTDFGVFFGFFWIFLEV